MTPADPPGKPASEYGAAPIGSHYERITQLDGRSLADSGPTRGRRETWFGDTRGSVLRFLGRWAFVVFIIIVAIIGRSVLLPFVFAGLIAYILAPTDRRLHVEAPERLAPDAARVRDHHLLHRVHRRRRRLHVPPRARALSRETARLGKEAPGLC